MKGERQNDISELLAFAGSRKVLTFIGLILSGISMLFSMVPYICIWLTARSLIEAAPHWREAVDITRYGWTAFIFAFGGIAIYFAGLMCTHLAAFRTASNIRKQGVHHVMDAPLGYFDSNASGLIRGHISTQMPQDSSEDALMQQLRIRKRFLRTILQTSWVQLSCSLQ